MLRRFRSNGEGGDGDGTTSSTIIIIVLVITILSIEGVSASAPLATSSSTPTSGTLFFSQIGAGVGKVEFAYDPTIHKFSLTNVTMLIRSLPGGSDGLVRDPASGNLLVGVNGGGPPLIHVVDPSSGKLVKTIGAGTRTPYHLMLDPTGTVAWTSGEPGTPAAIQLNPLGNGTAHPVTGDDRGIDTIAWKDQSHAFYTASGSGGYGHLGTFDLSTFVTTCVKSANGGCEIFPAAHGMAFDTFTGTLIMFGDSHITQVDPSTMKVLSDRTVTGAAFDQGTVDGKGHIFVASNAGTLFFEDYSLSGLIGDNRSFFENPPLIGRLDDVAPLIVQGTSSINPILSPGVVQVVGVAMILPMVVLVLAMIRGNRGSVSKE